MLRGLDLVLSRLEEYFCVFGLLLLTGVLFANVVLRYVFASGLTWSEELIRFLMIWISFIGISMATRRGEQLAVDIALVYSGPALSRAIRLVVNAISCVFSLLLAYYGYLVVTTLSRSAQVSPAMGIPMYLVYLVIPISGVLLALRFAQRGWGNSRGDDVPKDNTELPISTGEGKKLT